MKLDISEIQEIICQVGAHTVNIIDTPGFDDTTRSDSNILASIAEWMQSSYALGCDLSAQDHRQPHHKFVYGESSNVP